MDDVEAGVLLVVLHDLQRVVPRDSFISCWHARRVERVAFWLRNGGGDGGDVLRRSQPPGRGPQIFRCGPGTIVAFPAALLLCHQLECFEEPPAIVIVSQRWITVHVVVRAVPIALTPYLSVLPCKMPKARHMIRGAH